MSCIICLINSFDWNVWNNLFFRKKSPHNLLHDTSIVLKFQKHYATDSNCKNVLYISLHIWTTIHIWVQTIKYSIQLSCSFLLNFISWKNNVCDFHFGTTHYAFIRKWTNHLSTLIAQQDCYDLDSSSIQPYFHLN
jgi:hypothetical protein